MYLLIGSWLLQLGIWNCSVLLHCFAVLRARHWQQLLMDVPCVSVHSRCISSHKTGAYTFSFFEMRGRSKQPRLSHFGLSNYNVQGLHSPTRGILLYFSSPPWPESVQVVGFAFGCLLYTTEAAMSKRVFDCSLPQLHLLPARSPKMMLPRQWSEVSDFVARFCTLRECFACDSRMAVCCLTRATCKNVWHKSYTSGHCLMLPLMRMIPHLMSTNNHRPPKSKGHGQAPAPKQRGPNRTREWKEDN